MVDKLSIAFRAFIMRHHFQVMRYCYRGMSIDRLCFKLPALCWKGSFFQKNSVLSFIGIYVGANAFRFLLQAMLYEFSLHNSIGEKCTVIFVVCVCHSFRGIAFFNAKSLSFIRYMNVWSINWYRANLSPCKPQRIMPGNSMSISGYCKDWQYYRGNISFGEKIF